jgi:protein-L-isoaspartate(D-aspartate) O-methyltransferase
MCNSPAGLRVAVSIALGSAVLIPGTPVWAEDLDERAYADIRERMVRFDIANETLLGRDAVKDETVLSVMRTVPRHKFVPPEQIAQAYADRPLPIGYGQTISQPYIVAKMTELLRLKPGNKVLEIGTGSGYQAAVLAEIIDEVYTIEIVRPLAEQAARRLKDGGYDNVRTQVGDGYFGWKEHAPYDGIIVTAAASHIPPPLIEQLKPGGRIVIPVGPPLGFQQLFVLEKDLEGKITQRSIMGVRFVPLTGGEQSSRSSEKR